MRNDIRFIMNEQFVEWQCMKDLVFNYLPWIQAWEIDETNAMNIDFISEEAIDQFAEEFFNNIDLVNSFEHLYRISKDCKEM